MALVGGVYELGELLGEGGMGQVYRARHHLTDQDVAIKVLSPALSGDLHLRERFIGEAKALARLDHTNIVSLMNFIEEEGRFFLVMQYVQGMSLDDRLAAGPLSAQEAVSISEQVLAALEHAHGQGVVHRDIKPDNILLRHDGVVKVTDFGVARILGSARMTSTGVAVGTVWYMAPEQIMGADVDARTDLYAFGVTLYEMLSGRVPFDSESDYEVRKGHVEDRPIALDKVSDVSPRLAEAVGRALEKSPDSRYSSAGGFRKALVAALAPAVEIAPVSSKHVAPPPKPVFGDDDWVPELPSPPSHSRPAPVPRPKSAPPDNPETTSSGWVKKETRQGLAGVGAVIGGLVGLPAGGIGAVPGALVGGIVGYALPELGCLILIGVGIAIMVGMS